MLPGASSALSSLAVAAEPSPLRVAYFVHDLSDPAVERRVRMLALGGAEVSLLGFRRSGAAPAELAGAPVIRDLGRTYDSRFLQRAAAAAARSLEASALADQVRGADVLMARNLEMLAIAAAVRRRLATRPPLVYECLDIHRLMVAPGLTGQAMRALERGLMGEASTLIVSSPSFLSAYFEPLQGVGGRGAPQPLLVENRMLDGDAPAPRPLRRPAERPWRILWPGIIRCRKSLEVLRGLASRRPDLVAVTIRGRPSPAVFPDLAGELRGCPGISYEGPFEPDEVPSMYAGTHFTWAVDYFDPGRNSSWLLPNRLYQGGLYGSVPIAEADVEIGRWLERQGLGVRLASPERELEAFLEQLTPQDYRRLEADVAGAPRRLFLAGPDCCRELVAALGAGTKRG